MRVSIPSLPSLAPRALAAAAAIAFAGALAGCSLFAPSDAPPAMPSPAHYGATPLPERTAAAQGLAQRFDVGAQPVPDWWTRYRSPALDALVDEGLRNSPTLAAAEKSLSAAREQLRAQIGSSLLPTIDAGGQATRERALGMPAFGPQTVLYNVFAGQLQASYTLDLFGAARFANRALSKRVDVNAYQLESARRALAANIVTAAVTSAALAEQVATTERLVALAREQASDAAARHRLGAASRTDMLNTRQSAAALEASLPALRQQAQSARHALAVLLGRTPDAAPANLALADLHLPQDVPVVVPSTLLQARPDIRAAEAGLQAAAAEVGVATAQMFPQLSLSASMGHAGFKWPAMLSGAGAIWSVGASLTQPLFHGGALLAQRRAARASYDAAVDQYKQTVLAAFQDVADKLAALENDASALDASNRSAVAARGAFDDTAARVRLGALPPSAARASEQQYRNARLDEIRATGTRLVDTARLFQAMGTPIDGGPDARRVGGMSGSNDVSDVSGSSGVGGAHRVIDIHEAGAAQRADDAKRTGDARMLRANGKTEAAQASDGERGRRCAGRARPGGCRQRRERDTDTGANATDRRPVRRRDRRPDRCGKRNRRDEHGPPGKRARHDGRIEPNAFAELTARGASSGRRGFGMRRIEHAARRAPLRSRHRRAGDRRRERGAGRVCPRTPRSTAADSRGRQRPVASLRFCADMPRKTRTARAARRRTGRSDSRTLDERAPCSAHARNALRTRWRGDSARA